MAATQEWQLRHLWEGKNGFTRNAWARKQQSFELISNQLTNYIGFGTVHALRGIYINSNFTLPGGVYILEEDFVVNPGFTLTFSDRPSLAALAASASGQAWQGTRFVAAPPTTGNAARDAMLFQQHRYHDYMRFKCGGWDNTFGLGAPLVYPGYGGFGGEPGGQASPSYTVGDGGAGLLTGGLSGDNLAGGTITRAQPYGAYPAGFEAIGSGCDGVNNGGIAGAGGGGGGGGSGGATSQASLIGSPFGGMGGALVIIICRNFHNLGTININGEDAIPGTAWGGGGGGFLMVACERFWNSTINLRGGNGGVAGSAQGGGGGGGIFGGVISLGGDRNPSSTFGVGNSSALMLGTINLQKGTGGVNGSDGYGTGVTTFHEGFGMKGPDSLAEHKIFTGRAGFHDRISNKQISNPPFFSGGGAFTAYRAVAMSNALDMIYRYL